MNKIILASASPQRKTLLEGLGIEFEVVVPPIEETECIETDPITRNKQLACMKAESVAKDHPDAVVIGCDTLVVAEDGTMLEKPKNEDGARAMLRKLSGSTCTVHSAVCILGRQEGQKEQEGVSTTEVTFKELSDGEIEWWIGTGEWKDRSGAFQIEGKGQLMIKNIEGDWTGVVGLPVFLLGKMLRRFAVGF